VIGIQTTPENPLVIVIIGLLVLAVIAAAALILNKIQKKKQFLRSRYKIADFPHQYQDYKPEINRIRRMVRTVQSQGVHKITAPVQKEIDIFHGRRDITQSLLALVEKYSLGTFTIATSDGLVFASSGGDDANTNAATYGVITPQDPRSDNSTVIVPGLTHKDSALVGIIRTQNPVSEEILTRITQDTQAILNWWV
jgi:hypothetical protein